MANDLLYKASLHLGASPQNKRRSLLYKIPTVGNRQHIGLLLLLSCDAAVSSKFVDALNEQYPT
jgi:hypothetical protein